MQVINKQLLGQSAAGMRLIAQMTLYNRAEFGRLKEYVSEYYHPTLLEEQPVSRWIAVLKAQYRLVGKLHIRQVVGTDKYEVIVLTESERGQGFQVVNLAVEEDYPHRVVRFNVYDA